MENTVNALKEIAHVISNDGYYSDLKFIVEALLDAGVTEVDIEYMTGRHVHQIIENKQHGNREQ